MNISKANDSIELYKRRVEKLKEFSEWLSKEAKDEIAVEGIYYQYDSAANKNWKIFDKAIELFFNKHVLDSIIQNTKGQNNIFPPAFKAKMVKGLISRFNNLSHRLQSDSIKFKPEKLSGQFVPNKEDEFSERNSIIQYFIIDGEIFDYLYFTFEENETKLIGITVSEPQGEKGKKLMAYYQKLKKKP